MMSRPSPWQSPEGTARSTGGGQWRDQGQWSQGRPGHERALGSLGCRHSQVGSCMEAEGGERTLQWVSLGDPKETSRTRKKLVASPAANSFPLLAPCHWGRVGLWAPRGFEARVWG